MNLRDFLKSPNKHKGIPYLGEIKKKLDTNFDNTYREKKDKFSFKVFKTSKAVYIKVSIPSETVNDIVYDVFLELVKTNDSKSIFDYDVKLISNSPSFVFYHAFVYKKEKMIVDNKNLLKAIPRESLRKKPEKTNSYEILLYEKTTYYALKFIFEELKLNTNRIIGAATKVRENQINMVRFDIIYKKRKLAQQKEAEARKREKEKVKKKEDKERTKEVKEVSPKPDVKAITFTNKTKTTGRTKKTKRK